MSATVPDLLAQASSRYRDRPALVTDNCVLTYAQLDAAANRMARSLRRSGIGPGHAVALWAPKSIEIIIAIWGVTKAGAVYVPIDTNAPVARMRSIADDCGIAGLITTGVRAAEIADVFGNDGASLPKLWYVDEGPQICRRIAVSWSEVMAEEPVAPAIEAGLDDLAAVIYTSGTTGKPKGVMVPHRAIVWQSRWLAASSGLTSEDRLAGLTPLHSSLSTFDLCGPMHAGAALHVSDQPIFAFPSLLARFLSERRMTICVTVPTLLMKLLTHGNLSSCDLSALRTLVLCGEVLEAKYLREFHRLFPATQLVNCYGRTEAKIFTWHEITDIPDDDAARIPIGIPSVDCRAFVLDESGRPVATGSIGELWVGGPNLMKGYRGSPSDTSEALRMIESAPGVSVVACRTGDLVRARGDGNLEFVGRVDQEIKVHGFRVELGEIEATLSRHPAVAQAAALAVPDATGGQRLAVAVVLRAGMIADERQLQRHCAASLAPHMVPDKIEFLSALPVTSTGKLDRRQAAREARERAD